MKKKALAIALILVVAVSLFAGCAKKTPAPETTPAPQPQPAAEPLKIQMVTDVGGIDDKSFNASAYAGLKRAESELGVKIGYVQSKVQEDYVPNLKLLADQKTDLTWAIGFMMADALNEVAPQYPDRKFGIIDAVVEQPNVASATFKEEEGSFLVGVIAGLMTKTNKIGFIGGMEFPVIIKFESGFRAGVKAVNPKAEVLVAYAGKFDDPQAGYELAKTQYAAGADIIYHAAGYTGVGLFNAAKELGAGHWAIGVDSDQRDLAPDNHLVSMMKRVDNAVFSITKDLKEGKFEAKHYVFGLKEDGVGISESAKEHVPADVLAKVDEFKTKIVSGEIVVPDTREALEKFQVK